LKGVQEMLFKNEFQNDNNYLKMWNWKERFSKQQLLERVLLHWYNQYPFSWGYVLCCEWTPVQHRQGFMSFPATMGL